MAWQQLLNLKEEILKYAAKKNHADNENTYGAGDNEKYGHVKLKNSITDTTTNDNDNTTLYTDDDSHGASISAIKTYVATKIDKFYTKTEVDNKLDNIPTKTQFTNLNGQVTQLNSTINQYANNTHLDLNNPIIIDNESEINNINELITPGYYYYTKDENNSIIGSYNGESVNYKNAIVIVMQQPDGNILQYIYSTEEKSIEPSQEESSEEEPIEEEPIEEMNIE